LEQRQDIQHHADCDEKNLCKNKIFLQIVLQDSLDDTIPSTEFAIRFVQDIALPYLTSNRTIETVFYQYLSDCAASIILLADHLPKTSDTDYKNNAMFLALRLGFLEHLAGTVPGAQTCVELLIPKFQEDLRVNSAMNAKLLYQLFATISENVLADAELQKVVSCVDAVCADDMMKTLTDAAPLSKSVAPLTALASSATPTKESEEDMNTEEVDLEKLAAILRLITVLAQRIEYISSSIRPNDQMMRQAILQLFKKFCDIESDIVDEDIVLDIARSITSFFVTIVKDASTRLFVLPDEEDNDGEDGDVEARIEQPYPSIVQLVSYTRYILSKYVQEQNETSSTASKRMDTLKAICVNGLKLLNAHAHAWKAQKSLSRLFWDTIDRRFTIALHEAEAILPLNSDLGSQVHSLIVLMNTNKRPSLTTA